MPRSDETGPPICNHAERVRTRQSGTIRVVLYQKNVCWTAHAQNALFKAFSMRMAYPDYLLLSRKLDSVWSLCGNINVLPNFFHGWIAIRS